MENIVLYRILFNHFADFNYLKKVKKSYLFLILIIICEFPILAQSLFLSSINDDISKNGFTIGADYTGEYFSNISGGIKQEGTYLHNIGVNLDVDLDKLFGWENAQFHSILLGNQGGIPNDLVGSIQGISNIAAPNTWKIFEFWIEQNLWKNKIAILIGLFDLNSEFDTRVSSSIFINPSHGIGPEFSLSGKNGPSIFPSTSLTLKLTYKYSENTSFKIAVLDGVPGNLNSSRGTHLKLDKNDGLLFVGEVNYQNRSEDMDSDFFSYSLGGWYYTEKFEKINVSQILDLENFSSSYGLYLSAEKYLLVKPNNEALMGFLRFGIANSNVNQVSKYFGLGIKYVGLFKNRSEDILGLALSVTENSHDFVAFMSNKGSEISEFEYILEITYKFYLTNYLNIQPDLQYIINPTFTADENSLILGVRLNLAL